MQILMLFLSTVLLSGFLNPAWAVSYKSKSGDRGRQHPTAGGSFEEYNAYSNQSNNAVMFNVICRYKEKNDHRYRCFSAARFEKSVSHSGREVLDSSGESFPAAFQVECDGETLFNNGARRFTDREGTRIQALSGPYPAILLPPQALQEGRRKVRSSLELREQDLEGSCLVYTGEP
ncbi:MAG: hypothetical protein AB1540_05195 [Bdellovibrionota bacterium]